ncbi:formate--tetrahydrofolate ligase [Rhizomicrobium palustre]|uniref:Formate--tetrahydrofolate ligase n=1 Tax=Rhizomicrobium palustre TaxID=189966 RepID=A0A846MZA1_9PROT|nr:formate--tetrahydrofolate ligase [Rhizomicrobium palustre]
MSIPSNIEIARTAKMKRITAVAETLGISEEAVIPYGHTKAKLDLEKLDLKARPDGKLILVTAITPTPAGEGKTTTTIGLNDALNRIGKRSLATLREPSLGPCFGIKGGAAGGGHAQVVPMEDINLHFTGDFHAITSANNLLAALIDNHINWGNALGLDTRRITWRRCLDMNDRALRSIVSSLGGPANGYPREDGFDITVASEVMAILCLASDLKDLERRLAQIVIGKNREGRFVTAGDLNAAGAMAVLLKDAMLPNLVQSLENNPVLIHGGPFANIAHGCNSLIATRTALKLADYVVTEAGFGADLGAEKFFNIKCRKAGLKPDVAVLVATVRALKFHGGMERADLSKVNIEALSKGAANLQRHIGNLRKFGVPVVVAINHFAGDSDGEIAKLIEIAESFGCVAHVCKGWAEGGKGAVSLAEAVVAECDKAAADFKPLYPDHLPLIEKVRVVAREIYGAADIAADVSVRQAFSDLELAGFGRLPVCMAKTQYSFSTDAKLRGAPEGHVVKLREVRLSAGAEFVVVIAGDIMTMPGLPRVPAANGIGLNKDGQIEGLF